MIKTKNRDLVNDLPTPVIQHIKHLERIRQDFVANVSHELRTPLTVIRGYLDTLISQPSIDAEKLAPIFKQMYQHSIRMEHLIEDLLLLSHLENEEQETMEQSAVDIHTLLIEQINAAKEISGSLQHNINLHANPTLQLKGNPHELKSLFSNIIINAVKYTPAQGEIDIYWYEEDGQAVFKVKDTGIGIAKKHISRITERFYRVDKARSRDSGGTGLGLAIAKHVLLRHDGDLVIESQLGSGSVFTCCFTPGRVTFCR